jgi:hypothetical protein
VRVLATEQFEACALSTLRDGSSTATTGSTFFSLTSLSVLVSRFKAQPSLNTHKCYWLTIALMYSIFDGGNTVDARHCFVQCDLLLQCVHECLIAMTLTLC